MTRKGERKNAAEPRHSTGSCPEKIVDAVESFLKGHREGESLFYPGVLSPPEFIESVPRESELKVSGPLQPSEIHFGR